MGALTLSERQISAGDLGVSQEYLNDLNHKSVEDLVEMVSKELKPRSSS